VGFSCDVVCDEYTILISFKLFVHNVWVNYSEDVRLYWYCFLVLFILISMSYHSGELIRGCICECLLRSTCRSIMSIWVCRSIMYVFLYILCGVWWLRVLYRLSVLELCMVRCKVYVCIIHYGYERLSMVHIYISIWVCIRIDLLLYVLLYCVVIESIVLVECTLVVVYDKKVCIIHYGYMYVCMKGCWMYLDFCYNVWVKYSEDVRFYWYCVWSSVLY